MIACVAVPFVCAHPAGVPVNADHDGGVSEAASDLSNPMFPFAWTQRSIVLRTLKAILRTFRTAAEALRPVLSWIFGSPKVFDSETLAQLRSDLESEGGRVVQARDGVLDWLMASAMWSIRRLAFPVAILQPTTATSVSRIIELARQHNVPLRVKSGGHDYEGYSQHNGIQIHFAHMKQMTFDFDRGVATVQPGALFEDLYQALLPSNWTFVGGNCPTTSATGLTLGGAHVSWIVL